MGASTGGWTAGVVRPGIAGDPSPSRTRSDLCAGIGHPPATYSAWMDKTFCLCGEVIVPGDVAQHVACCGGPLIEYLTTDGTYAPATPETWVEALHATRPKP